MKRFVWILLAAIGLFSALASSSFAQEGAQATYATPVASAPVPSEPFSLQIDNEEVFDGMDSSYQNGYVPVTQDGICRVILPLRAVNGPDFITVSVDLGDPASSPFVFENYDKTIPLEEHTATSGAQRLCYLVDLSLPLTQSAAPGRYPVTITCSGLTGGGQPFQQTFVVYATIEGVSPEPSESADPSEDPNSPAPLPGEAEDPADEPIEPDADMGAEDPGAYSGGGSEGGGSAASATQAPVLQPKLMLTSYSVAPSPAVAGEPFTITFTITNTSEKQLAQNILLAVSGATAEVVPADGSGSMYFKRIDPGKSVSGTVAMTSAPAIAPGPQKIQIDAGYDDSKGTAYTSQESVAVQVRQPVRFEVDEPDIPSTVHSGDTMTLSINVMNLGRATISNVMAQLEAPGLVPQNTLFLGNLESGTAKKDTMYVFVRPEQDTDGKPKYGSVSGSLNVTCEDEYGQTYTQALDFSTYLEAPVFAANPTQEPAPEEKPDNQWWISLVVAGALAAGAICVWGVVHARRKKEAADEED